MKINIEFIYHQEQCDCEKICSEFLRPLCTYTGKVRRKLKGQSLSNQKDEVCLLRKAHVDYLTAGLETLSEGFISLDASRPWICYWICHALYLLHCEPVHLFHELYQRFRVCRMVPVDMVNYSFPLCSCSSSLIVVVVVVVVVAVAVAVAVVVY